MHKSHCEPKTTPNILSCFFCFVSHGFSDSSKHREEASYFVIARDTCDDACKLIICEKNRNPDSPTVWFAAGAGAKKRHWKDGLYLMVEESRNVGNPRAHPATCQRSRHTSAQSKVCQISGKADDLLWHHLFQRTHINCSVLGNKGKTGNDGWIRTPLNHKLTVGLR